MQVQWQDVLLAIVIYSANISHGTQVTFDVIIVVHERVMVTFSKMCWSQTVYSCHRQLSISDRHQEHNRSTLKIHRHFKIYILAGKKKRC